MGIVACILLVNCAGSVGWDLRDPSGGGDKVGVVLSVRPQRNTQNNKCDIHFDVQSSVLCKLV